jgi:hypothetical protein
MTVAAKQPTMPITSSKNQRSAVFEYLDQEVAKDMAGFYTAFGLTAPNPAIRSLNRSSEQRKPVAKR